MILDSLRLYVMAIFLKKTQIWSEAEISNYLQRTLSLEAEQRETQSGKKLLLGNAESQTQLACFALFFSSHFFADSAQTGILLYFPMSVCVLVCHRRDISSFLDNLIV